MRRLIPLLALAAGLACLAPARGGAPPPPPSGGGGGTPAGYTVRNISAGNAPIKLSGASRIWLKGDGSLRAGRSGAIGLLLEDCQDILVSNLTFSGWYIALRGNNCRRVECRDVIATKNFQQGFLWANGHQITLRRCEGSKTSGIRTSQHGCYFGNWQSGYTEQILVEDCRFFDSTLAEFQVNSESASRAAKGVVVRRTKITNAKFAVNLLGAQGFLLDACDIKSPKKAASLDRPSGRPWPSTGTMRGGSCVGSVYKGSGSSISKQ